MPAVDAGRLDWKAALNNGLFLGIVKYFSCSGMKGSFWPVSIKSARKWHTTLKLANTE